MLRVLMLDSESTWRGGENQLYLLMRGLREENVHVVLAAPQRAAITRRVEKLGVACWPLDMGAGLDLMAARRLARHLARERYDIVHCHASHAHSIAFLATWPRRLGQAWRVRTRFGREPAVSSRASAPAGPRLVVSRRVDFPFPRRGPSALKYRHGADVYLAISTGVRDVLVACGVDPERIRLVPSGIDVARLAALRAPAALRAELGLDAGTPVVGNVAALAPHKSQVDFVRAARLVADAIPAARFLIVGEGNERPALEILIGELGLRDRFLLTGFRDDALEILSLFDCFVLSSSLEGLGTSIMDAQVLGVPVVATRTGGVPDLVEDGETGLLVAPRQPQQLAAAVLRLLRDPALHARLQRNARELAPRYDCKHMVNKTLDTYRRCLDAT